MYFYMILTLSALWLSPLGTSSVSAISSDCSGRGYRPGNSSNETCVCDEPYDGDDCELCASGYYGNPADGSVCYLPCSSEIRLLYNFTSAGVGVLPSWLATERPSLSNQPYCLWVIAPLISESNSSSMNDGSLSSFSHTATDNGVFNPIPTELIIQLNFRNNQISPCFAETVLIYAGLPEFLTPLRLNSSLTPRGSLVGSFTGTQLSNLSTSVSSDIVTVVYYSSTSLPLSQLTGFNMTVHVGSNLTEENGHFVNNSAFDEADDLCEMSTNTSSEMDTIFLSTLLSLPLSINETEGANSSNRQFAGGEEPCLTGRHHHTTVYDPCSNSLLVYGGLDQSEKPCEGVVFVNLSLILPHGLNSSYPEREEGERAVRRSMSNGTGPSERFFHTAVLLPCQQNSSGSQMLVYGGFTSRSRLTTSSELWMYDGDSQQWTQLEPAPVSLAAHSSTLTADGRMVVIGGVNSDLHISPGTYVYHLLNDSWEAVQTRTLDLPGVYGHSAVYNAATDSVLVYGGYAYTRPQAQLSSEVYTLDVATLTWRRVQLANEIPSRMFHSMVVVGNLLVIQGGLLSQQHPSGLEGVCPSNDVTLIDLAAVCGGRPAITISLGGGSSCEYGRYGHTLTTNRDEVFVMGGEDVTGNAFLSLLHLPSSLSCSLAVTMADCLALPSCSPCLNNQTSDFIACYNASDSNATLLCSTQDGVLLLESDNSSSCQHEPLTCEHFESCGSCLSTDLALELGCVWCSCEECCIPPSLSSNDTDCPCEPVNSTVPDVCFLDSCFIPSCADCLAEGSCQWLTRQIRDNPGVPNGILVATPIPERGCYSNLIHNVIVTQLGLDISTSNCPAPCGTAMSCDTCVAMTTPTGGNMTCVWAEYSQECLSADVVPLSCSLGSGCGPVLSSREQCPTPCRSRDTCQQCLEDPTCVWLNNEIGGTPLCVEIEDLDSELSNLPDDVMVYYYECPVGVSCYQYCHGNSEMCSLRGGGAEGGVNQVTDQDQLVLWVSEEMDGDVECLDCERFSHGSRCQSCLTGYFNLNPEAGLVNCQRCTCNGHDLDDCDPVTGVCSCQNNTRSIACQGRICSTFSQCSLCETGFAGNPRNNGQCYRQIVSSIVGNFSLPSNQSTSFYFGPGSDGYFFSNVDVHAKFVVTRGLLDVYISTDPSIVMVTLNRQTWAHQLSFQRGVAILSSPSLRSDPTNQDPDRRRYARREAEDSDWSGEGDDIIRRDRRALQHSYLSSSRDNGLYHFIVDDRLSLVVHHDQEDFASSDYYITVLAREDSQFYFYYRQDLPKLNIYIFFSIFECFFVLGSTVLILIYQLGLYFVKRRRRRRDRLKRERRANRPLVKLVVYLGEKKQPCCRKKKKPAIKHPLPPPSDLKPVCKVNKEGEQCGKGEEADGGGRRTKKRVRIAETVHTCSPAAGAIELEGQTVKAEGTKDGNMHGEKNKRKKKYQILSSDDIHRWPVCIQPTANDVACLSTVLIQLPASTNKTLGQLCSGTALVDYPKASLEEKDKEKGKRKLRLRRKNRLAPAPGNQPATTSL